MDNKEKSHNGVVVSAINSRSGALSRLKNPKVVIPFILFVVVVAAAVIVHANQAAFVIDGKKYSKSSISAMAKYASDQNPRYTKASAAKNIFNMYKTQVAAEKAEITPNATELKAAEKTLTFSNSNSGAAKDYVQLIAYTLALPNSYARYQEGGYQGTYFVFDYSEKVQITALQEDPVPGYHNEDLIVQDQAYAKQQADAAYKLYQSNKGSTATIVKNIASAQKVGFNGQVVHFDPGHSSLHSQVLYNDIYKYITSQSKPGLSTIKVGLVATDKDQKGNDFFAAGYYYFADITQAGKIVKDPGKLVNDQLKEQKTTYYGI